MATEGELLAWAQGMTDAGAALLGGVASYVGPDSPLMDMLVVRLGELLPPGRPRDDLLSRGRFAVVVQPVEAPDGSARVLLQLPDGMMLLLPKDARALAALLTTVAEEVDAL